VINHFSMALLTYGNDHFSGLQIRKGRMLRGTWSTKDNLELLNGLRIAAVLSQEIREHSSRFTDWLAE